MKTRCKRYIGLIVALIVSSNSMVTFFSKAVETNYVELEKRYLIEDVPYVGQKTDFYCAYACTTMMLNYFGIDTNQYEVLFNSGAGYSLVYSHPQLKRLIAGSTATSVWKKDREFLAELYGLDYEESWFTYSDIPKEERWENYWNSVKDNISQNRPVLTWVDPTSLPSIRDAVRKEMNVSEKLWNLIPEIVWYFFPSTISHVILLVGYDESNGTICYNDPGTEIFRHPECGIYRWMTLSDYEKAMRNLQLQSEMAYFIGSFKNTSEEPLNKTEIFKKVYNRNIEKMKGNLSEYDSHITQIWNCSYLGINALEKQKHDFEPGLLNRTSSILRYKFMNLIYLRTPTYLLYKLFDKLLPTIVNISDFESTMVYYYQLVLERQDIANYLEELQYEQENERFSEICRNDSILLSKEAKNYEQITALYSEFHKKGVFLTFPKAVQIINQMKEKVEKIIQIEETIINNY